MECGNSIPEWIHKICSWSISKSLSKQVSWILMWLLSVCSGLTQIYTDMLDTVNNSWSVFARCPSNSLSDNRQLNFTLIYMPWCFTDANPYLKLTFYYCADNWSIQTGLIGSTGAKFLFTLMLFCVSERFFKWSEVLNDLSMKKHEAQ